MEYFKFEFDKMINSLLDSDTNGILEDLAERVVSQGVPDSQECQIFGIALLAVDDAKITDLPSSANPIYKAVFDRAKELINGETRSTHITR
jgi:hypothetical protein